MCGPGWLVFHVAEVLVINQRKRVIVVSFTYLLSFHCSLPLPALQRMAGASTIDEIVTSLANIQVSRYACGAAMTFMFYDYFLTLSDVSPPYEFSASAHPSIGDRIRVGWLAENVPRKGHVPMGKLDSFLPVGPDACRHTQRTDTGRCPGLCWPTTILLVCGRHSLITYASISGGVSVY